MSDPFASLPRGKFGAILADPPWPFATWSHKGQGRSGEAHYGTMSHAEMEALPVARLAAPDCTLFMWVVQTQLEQASNLLRAWKFTLKSVAFVWIKGDPLPLFPDDVVTQMGMGKWTRAEHEQCWLATRGQPQRQQADVRQVIDDRRREHSRKPDGIHDRIERLVAGPYLELFARQERPGWTCWGNETKKFNGHRLPREPEPFACLSGQCRSPMACGAFGYCREKNFNQAPPEPQQLSWDDMWTKPFDPPSPEAGLRRTSRPELVGEPPVAAIRRTLEGGA